MFLSFLIAFLSLFTKKNGSKDEVAELAEHLAKFLAQAHPDMRWMAKDERVATNGNGNGHEADCCVAGRPKARNLAEFLIPLLPEPIVMLKPETFVEGGKRQLVVLNGLYERAIIDGLKDFASAKKSRGFHIKSAPAQAVTQ